MNLIDHLPRNTHYMQAVANDEEHARLLLEATKGQEPKPYAPPMATWSAEADLLANLIDEVRRLKHLTLAVNSKGSPKPPAMYPRPRTAMEKVRKQQREQSHRSLVARVLPHKST